MKIVVDSRMLGQGYGIGTYILELAKRLPKVNPEYHFVFLMPTIAADLARREITADSINTQIEICDIPHYSLEEQTKLPQVLRKLNPDLVHFPNFNIPILYPGKFIVTIHDLVHHHLPGESRSALFRSWPYRLVVFFAILRAKAIIAISKTTKDEILKKYPATDKDKIYVITEGAPSTANEPSLPGETYLLKEKYGISEPYILFVGVHEVKKNLPMLAQIFNKLVQKHPNFSLVLAGREDKNHPEVKVDIEKAAGNAVSRIIRPGFIEPADLPTLYRHATAFVNASAYEGFGLPGLEAMCYGVPVAVLNTRVFREIYEEAAVYFNSIEQGVEVIDKIIYDEHFREKLTGKGFEQVKKYSWDECAVRTVKLYESV